MKPKPGDLIKYIDVIGKFTLLHLITSVTDDCVNTVHEQGVGKFPKGLFDALVDIKVIGYV